MNALIAVEAVVIVLLVVLVAGLLRSHAEILRRLHELGAGDTTTSLGTPRPRPPGSGRAAGVEAVTGVTPDGRTISIPLSGTRGTVLLAFLTTGCASCRPLWRALRRGVSLPDPNTRIVVATKGPEAESPAEIADLAPPGVAVVMSTEAWDQMAVPVAPFFALVDATSGSVLGEGAAGSWGQVGDLMRRALGDAGASRLHTTTAERLADTDEELRRSGIAPGDPSLYSAPTEGGDG